jgi:hypothetical protein
MKTRARNPNGTFKSALDVQMENDEAEMYANVKAKMNAGMTFDEAWLACGGDIIPTIWTSLGDIIELRDAYAKVRGSSGR